MSQVNYLVELFKKYDGYIHHDLYTKYNKDSGWGFFAKKQLKQEETLIKVPFILTINAKDFLDFLDGKKINYPHIDFLNAYIKTLPSIEFYKEHHPCFCDPLEKDLMIQIVKKNSFLKKILLNHLKHFEHLNNNEQFVFVTFLTRSTTNKNNEKVLMPILDIVNFDYNGKKYLVDNKSVSIANNQLIEKDEEICCEYTSDMDPIEFFITWGFFPEEYKSFNIPNQSLFVEGLNNNNVNFNFIKKDNRYYFNENLIFKKQEIPKNINNFLKIFPSNQTQKVILGIMDSCEKSINEDLTNKVLLEKKYSNTIINFCKCVKLYIENIRLYKLLLTL
jgi:hypothetical protein